MSPEELKARARRIVEEVLNQGDLTVANELISPDCVHHVPGDQPAPGLAGLRCRLSLVRAIFPDFHAIVEDQIAEGDRVVQRITGYGTHEGELAFASYRSLLLAFLVMGGVQIFLAGLGVFSITSQHAALLYVS